MTDKIIKICLSEISKRDQYNYEILIEFDSFDYYVILTRQLYDPFLIEIKSIVKHDKQGNELTNDIDINNLERLLNILQNI